MSFAVCYGSTSTYSKRRTVGQLDTAVMIYLDYISICRTEGIKVECAGQNRNSSQEKVDVLVRIEILPRNILSCFFLRGVFMYLNVVFNNGLRWLR
jgi:hypothetical protein